ncbi:MAG: hypothetical protein ABI559_05895 [Chloroflexota bacterium]
MVNYDMCSAVLTELDAIANAAMTGEQREARAASVMMDVSVEELHEALGSVDLRWNQRKASAYGVSPDAWQRALGVAGLPNCDSLGTLLKIIHRAESAAAMIRAGYRPATSSTGALTWFR